MEKSLQLPSVSCCVYMISGQDNTSLVHTNMKVMSRRREGGGHEHLVSMEITCKRFYLNRDCMKTKSNFFSFLNTYTKSYKDAYKVCEKFDIRSILGLV